MVKLIIPMLRIVGIGSDLLAARSALNISMDDKVFSTISNGKPYYSNAIPPSVYGSIAITYPQTNQTVDEWIVCHIGQHPCPAPQWVSLCSVVEIIFRFNILFPSEARGIPLDTNISTTSLSILANRRINLEIASVLMLEEGKDHGTGSLIE